MLFGHYLDPEKFNVIDGGDAERQAKYKFKKYKIEGKLLKGVNYIFRWSYDHKVLVPYRVSMHPKTAANLQRGSERYGFGRILREEGF